MRQTIFGRCIYQSSSSAKVYQNWNYRWLKFEGTAVQTIVHRRHHARAIFHYIVALTQLITKTPGNICLLGLGGGGILHALYSFLNGVEIIAVEASQEVIDIGHDFFYLNQLKNLTIYNQLAEDFVQTSKQQFSTLIVDLHDGVNFPASCSTLAFWENCASLLAPNGILIVNIMHAHKNIPLFNLISAAFSAQTIVIPIEHSLNTLIMAGTTKNYLNLDSQHCFPSIVYNEVWGLVARLPLKKSL